MYGGHVVGVLLEHVNWAWSFYRREVLGDQPSTFQQNLYMLQLMVVTEAPPPERNGTFRNFQVLNKKIQIYGYGYLN